MVPVDPGDSTGTRIVALETTINQIINNQHIIYIGQIWFSNIVYDQTDCNPQIYAVEMKIDILKVRSVWTL